MRLRSVIIACATLPVPASPVVQVETLSWMPTISDKKATGRKRTRGVMRCTAQGSAIYRSTGRAQVDEPVCTTSFRRSYVGQGGRTSMCC